MDREVRRLALGALLLGFVGPEPPRWLLDALADGLGGVVLFGSNVGDGRDVAKLTGQLRAAAGRDIVVAIDEEGGDVTRLDTVRGSASPGAAALGWLDDVAATEAVYAALAARLAEAGVTVDLAPVADANVDPDNPVIGVRSFGADPKLVARHVAAAVRGLQRQGVAACVKHFPGHGATSVDSHHELPILDRPPAQLAEVELPPFVAAIEAGTRAVMTGHLLVPSLDASKLATASYVVTTGLLRDELGFEGTVVTDALEMHALADAYGLAGGFVAALAAGADAVETGALDYPELTAAIPAAVQCALDDGTVSVERLRAAAARTAALASTPAAVPVLMPDVAARCLEVVGSVPSLQRPQVVEARPPDGMASGQLPWSLADLLAARLPGAEVLEAGPDSSRPLPLADDRSLVLVVRDPHRHPWQQALLRAAATRQDAVVVDVGWPSVVPDGVPTIRTRGVAPGLLTAAADLLAGNSSGRKS